MFLITLFIKRHKGVLKKKVPSINFWPLFAHVYTDTHSKCVLTKLWTVPSWFWLGSEQPWRRIKYLVMLLRRTGVRIPCERGDVVEIRSGVGDGTVPAPHSTPALSPRAAAPGKAAKSWSDADAFIKVKDLELVCEWNGHREIHDLECTTEESPEPVQMFRSLRFRNVSRSLR